MKKRNIMVALLCSMCLAVSSPIPAMADGTKVVTLGADLTQDQKNTMMNYFKADSSQVQVITVTNQDERALLGNYVPSEQIGTRTLSCAYVKPTQSGGIKVRTANLNWVTGNMIATTLSTSGVKNCEVVAACPMEVSGTGALTGIQMAYEKASGEKLDETKTKLANQEIVTTGELADKVGKNEATTVVNQSKMDVIQNGVQNADEIQNIVINVAEQNNISVSQDDIDKIVSLLKQISQQDYNYDDVKETLEQVDANTTGQASSSDDTLDGESSDDTVDVDGDSADDIVNNVNDSILGDDVIQSSTEDPGLEKETGADSQDTSNETGIPDATDDGTYSNEESTDESSTDESASDESTSDENSTDESASDESGTDESASDESSTDESTSDESSTDESASDETASDETGIPEATEDTDSSDQADSAENDTSVLSEEAKNNYDKFVLFVKGEYEGDADSLLAATEDTEAVATVTLDEQTAKNVAETVEKDYYDILKDGTESYEADGTEKYQSTELNMMDQKLKKLFDIDSSQDDTDTTDGTAAILADVPQEDKQTLYKETMKYLAGLYGENTDSSEESAAE